MSTRRAIIASILLALFTVLIATVFPKQTLAATVETQGLTTSPITTVLNVKPGKSASTVLQVENTTGAPINVAVKLDEFSADGSNGQASFITPPASDPTTSWVHFSKSDFIAQPDTWVPVTMTINLPSNASLGYYYAVLFSRSGTIKKATSNFKTANAIFVLVNTSSGNESRQLQITNFSTSRSIYDFLPISFNILVNNPGNIFLAPQGELYISRKSGGKTIDTIPVNLGGNDILPNSSRQFSAQWSDGLPIYSDKKVNGQVVTGKNGKPEQYLNWNTNKPLSKFRFGKYYASLVMVYNNGTIDVPIEGQVSFWVIPYSLILEILIVIVLVILLWRYTKKLIRRLWHKVKHMSPKETEAKKNQKNTAP